MATKLNDFATKMLEGMGQTVAEKNAKPDPERGIGSGAGILMKNQMEMSALRDRIADLEKTGNGQGLMLDPKDVQLSPLANRIENAYLTAEFKELKEDIARTGGNVQAICVVKRDNGKYMLIFGHRRLRACRDLGLKVKALEVTELVDDETLFLLMHSENMSRVNPSAYEQGLWFANVLERGIYPSARALAEKAGISHAWVNKAIMTAKLPDEVVKCFVSPIDITSKAAEKITEALEKDRDGVLLRALYLAERTDQLSPEKVVQHLLYQDGVTGAEKPRPLKLGKKSYGTVRRDGKGRLMLALAPAFSRDDMTKLLALAEELAKKKPEFKDSPKAVKAK